MGSIIVGCKAKIIHKGYKYCGEEVLVLSIDGHSMTATVSFVVVDGEDTCIKNLIICIGDLLCIPYDGRNVTKWDAISDVWTPNKSKYGGLLGSIRHFFRNDPRIP